MRALAGQSAQAVGEIESLAGAIRAQAARAIEVVTAGSVLSEEVTRHVNQALAAFEAIGQAVADGHHGVDQILTSTEDHQDGIGARRADHG